MFEQPLNQNTFPIYASKYYNNPVSMGIHEFNKDLKLLTYIKRILRRYHNNNIIKLPLLRNHIITLRNTFSTIPSVRLLFYYCDSYTYPALKTMLTFLQMLPANNNVIPEANIDLIRFDDNLIALIRQEYK